MGTILQQIYDLCKEILTHVRGIRVGQASVVDQVKQSEVALAAGIEANHRAMLLEFAKLKSVFNAVESPEAPPATSIEIEPNN